MKLKHMKLARAMALKSTSKFRLGAVVASKNRVISAGYNKMKHTHPKMRKYQIDKDFNIGLHAEVHSCIGISALDLKGADLYVYRVKRNGGAGMAKPCQTCMRFLISVEIGTIYYSSDEGFGKLCLN